LQRGAGQHSAALIAGEIAMHHLRRLSLLLPALVCLCAVRPCQGGSPPVLVNSHPVTHVFSTGERVDLMIEYHSDELPVSAGVNLRGPDGIEIPIKATQTDLSSVHDHDLIVISYMPQTSGTYQYRFYAQNADGKATFPSGDDPMLTFEVRPNWLPWAIIFGGFCLSFLVVSTVVYQVMTRLFSASQKSGARAGIMIGIVCWAVCILYALNLLTNLIALILTGLIVILLLVSAIVTR
jgi:hypothetical protein